MAVPCGQKQESSSDSNRDPAQASIEQSDNKWEKTIAMKTYLDKLDGTGKFHSKAAIIIDDRQAFNSSQASQVKLDTCPVTPAWPKRQ